VIGINSGSERPGVVALASGAGPDAIIDILARYDACAPAGAAPPVQVDVAVTPPVPAPVPQSPDTGTQDLLADLQRQIDELKASGIQGPPGPPGPQGEPGTVDIEAIVKAIVEKLPPPKAPDIDAVVAGVMARLPADDAPLFHSIVRDATTGEIIPQFDPETGKTYTVQPINRGDDWTIYFHSTTNQGAE